MNFDHRFLVKDITTNKYGKVRYCKSYTVSLISFLISLDLGTLITLGIQTSLAEYIEGTKTIKDLAESNSSNT